MPLRNHFHPPLSKTASWDDLGGGWAGTISRALSRDLPPRYQAEPRAEVGPDMVIQPGKNSWSDVPPPTFSADAGWTDFDEYGVKVVDGDFGRLVASVEIVSPSNKDRPQNRQAFVFKCVDLLQQSVCVVIADVVPHLPFNLFHDVLDFIGVQPPEGNPPTTYAAVCRAVRRPKPVFEAWDYTLTVGEPLPALPLWIADDQAVRLDLEATYEDTCRPARHRLANRCGH